MSGTYSTKLKEYFLFIRTNNLFKKLLYNELFLLEKMCNRIFTTVLLIKDIL